MTEKTYIMITETGNAYKVTYNNGIGGTIGILDKKVVAMFGIIGLNGQDIIRFKRVQDFLGKHINFSINRDKVAVTTEVIEIYEKIC